VEQLAESLEVPGEAPVCDGDRDRADPYRGQQVGDDILCDPVPEHVAERSPSGHAPDRSVITV